MGSGCVKCMELEKATRAAVSELRLDYEIEHVTDFAENRRLRSNDDTCISV